VVGSWQELLGIKDDIVLKCATGFGGGIGARGSLCGIISGSVMVIGMKKGRGREDDMSVSMDAYMRCARLMEWFNAEFGSQMCSTLTGGVDFRDPEQLSKYYESGHQKCVEMAGRTSAKLAELLE
jgi:C_GCAxxG_C_C family probable redox protein